MHVLSVYDNTGLTLLHRETKLSNSVTEFSKVGSQSPFERLIHYLKTQSNLFCLAKKIMKWFDDSKGNTNLWTIGSLGKKHAGFSITLCT